MNGSDFEHPSVKLHENCSRPSAGHIKGWDPTNRGEHGKIQ